MDKELLKNLKEKLEKEKIAVEEELKKFAEKDEKISGDWDTKYPRQSGSNLEEAANEVEEYGNLLPLEHGLETKLKDIDEALKKIENDKYGICEKCGEKIGEDRLEISPETRFCSRCK